MTTKFGWLSAASATAGIGSFFFGHGRDMLTLLSDLAGTLASRPWDWLGAAFLILSAVLFSVPAAQWLRGRKGKRRREIQDVAGEVFAERTVPGTLRTAQELDALARRVAELESKLAGQ